MPVYLVKAYNVAEMLCRRLICLQATAMKKRTAASLIVRPASIVSRQTKMGQRRPGAAQAQVQASLPLSTKTCCCPRGKGETPFCAEPRQ